MDFIDTTFRVFKELENAINIVEEKYSDMVERKIYVEEFWDIFSPFLRTIINTPL